MAEEFEQVLRGLRGLEAEQLQIVSNVYQVHRNEYKSAITAAKERLRALRPAQTTRKRCKKSEKAILQKAKTARGKRGPLTSLDTVPEDEACEQEEPAACTAAEIVPTTVSNDTATARTEEEGPSVKADEGSGALTSAPASKKRRKAAKVHKAANDCKTAEPVRRSTRMRQGTENVSQNCFPSPPTGRRRPRLPKFTPALETAEETAAISRSSAQEPEQYFSEAQSSDPVAISAAISLDTDQVLRASDLPPTEATRGGEPALPPTAKDEPAPESAVAVEADSINCEANEQPCTATMTAAPESAGKIMGDQEYQQHLQDDRLAPGEDRTSLASFPRSEAGTDDFYTAPESLSMMDVLAKHTNQSTPQEVGASCKMSEADHEGDASQKEQADVIHQQAQEDDFPQGCLATNTPASSQAYEAIQATGDEQAAAADREKTPVDSQMVTQIHEERAEEDPAGPDENAVAGAEGAAEGHPSAYNSDECCEDKLTEPAGETTAAEQLEDDEDVDIQLTQNLAEESEVLPREAEGERTALELEDGEALREQISDHNSCEEADAMDMPADDSAAVMATAQVEEEAGQAQQAPERSRLLATGANLVTSFRSLIPTKATGPPLPGAGKRAPEVDALKAAEAARKKEAAREAERLKQKEMLKKQKAERAKHTLQVKAKQEEAQKRAAHEAKRREEAMRKKEEEAAARRKAKEDAEKREREDRQRKLEDAKAKRKQEELCKQEEKQKGTAKKHVPEADALAKSLAKVMQDDQAAKQPKIAEIYAKAEATLMAPQKAATSALKLCVAAWQHSTAPETIKSGEAGSSGTHFEESLHSVANQVPDVGESIEIRPYRSDDESEEEDDPEVRPLWAREPNLQRQLYAQQKMDPDEIFQQHAKTCSLDEVFDNIGTAQDAKKDYNRRTSSGNWLDDRVTWKEELAYKKKMGYM